VEARLTQVPDAGEKRALEIELQSIKQRTENGSAEAQARAKEAEALSQFQTEQSRLDQLNAELAQMEQALDAAIRQLAASR